MQKELRISTSSKMNKLRAAACDLLATILSTIILFFAILYGVCGQGFGYSRSVKTYNSKMEQYSLNLGNNKTYQEYETVIQKFYFEYFPSQTLQYVQKSYTTVKTIEHAYNVTVLFLPVSPTPENYKTDYFEYYQNTDGTFDVNKVGLKISGKGGDYYLKSMKDLFYNSYQILPSLLLRFDNEFNSAAVNINNCKLASRLIAGGISLLAFYFIVPLCRKYDSTVFEGVFGIGKVNSKTGYKEKKYKIIIRGLLLCILPILGLYWFNRYGIILLIILPIFANYIVMLLSLDGRELIEKITFTQSVDYKESDIFETKGEEIVYYRDENDNEITDPEYYEKLKSTEEVSIYSSRDEEIRSKIKKKESKK